MKTLSERVREFKAIVIETQLEASGGHMENTARALGMTLRGLHRLMRRLGMPGKAPGRPVK